jgi:hypothetical protein
LSCQRQLLELTEHRLGASDPLSIAGPFGIRQDLLQGPSAPESPGRRPPVSSPSSSSEACGSGQTRPRIVGCFHFWIGPKTRGRRSDSRSASHPPTCAVPRERYHSHGNPHLTTTRMWYTVTLSVVQHRKPVVVRDFVTEVCLLSDHSAQAQLHCNRPVPLRLLPLE